MSRYARWLELGLLFIALPCLGLALEQQLSQWLVPVLIAIAAVCLGLILQDPGFKRFRLINGAKLAPALWRRRSAFGAGLAASGLLYVTYSEANWFHLPSQETHSWLLLLVAYPLLSVVPQELIFRTFFFHRYKKIIPRKIVRTWLSALVFAWAHIIYRNWIAVALAFAGGILFAFTYAKKRSTLACVVEHSLWGIWLFTFGLGQYLDSSQI